MGSGGKALAATVLIIVAIFLSLIAVLAALNRRDQTVGLNKEIQYDDFAFSITGVRKEKSLGVGGEQQTARGDFYVVKIKVANHAVRVDYRFKNDSAILVDQAGREFHLSSEAQRVLRQAGGEDGECSQPIPAGGSCVTEVVFDLPTDSQPSHLRFSEGGPIGDLLDFVFFGNKRIDLRSPAN